MIHFQTIHVKIQKLDSSPVYVIVDSYIFVTGHFLIKILCFTFKKLCHLCVVFNLAQILLSLDDDEI